MWISGLVGKPHHIDIGPTELTIRNANIQAVAKFANASEDFRAYGSVAAEGGLFVKGSVVF